MRSPQAMAAASQPYLPSGISRIEGAGLGRTRGISGLEGDGKRGMVSSAARRMRDAAHKSTRSRPESRPFRGIAMLWVKMWRTRMASKTTLHIPSLDGIRALAALMVFVAHAGLGDLVPGGFGVTIFFFLSGYLITTLLRIEHSEQGSISLGKFYLRRAYRILPPMYITLGIAAAIAAWQGTMGNVTAGAVIAQLLQMTNYYTIGFGERHLVPYTGVMWSLSVEEHYYLLYPLALLVLLPRFDRRKIGWILAGGCVLVLIWRYCLTSVLHVGSDYTEISTD